MSWQGHPSKEVAQFKEVKRIFMSYTTTGVFIYEVSTLCNP